jgi:hypothetical protein
MLGSLILAGLIVGLDYALLGMLHHIATDSLLNKIINYTAFVLLIPGGIIAWLVAGGGHDMDLKLALEINVVVYAVLGYVFFRFLEWKKSRRR